MEIEEIYLVFSRGIEEYLVVAEDEGVEVLELAERGGERIEEELVVRKVQLLQQRTVTNLQRETVQTVVVHDQLGATHVTPDEDHI